MNTIRVSQNQFQIHNASANKDLLVKFQLSFQQQVKVLLDNTNTSVESSFLAAKNNIEALMSSIKEEQEKKEWTEINEGLKKLHDEYANLDQFKPLVGSTLNKSAEFEGYKNDCADRVKNIQEIATELNEKLSQINLEEVKDIARTEQNSLYKKTVSTIKWLLPGALAIAVIVLAALCSNNLFVIYLVAMSPILLASGKQGWDQLFGKRADKLIDSQSNLTENKWFEAWTASHMFNNAVASQCSKLEQQNNLKMLVQEATEPLNKKILLLEEKSTWNEFNENINSGEFDGNSHTIYFDKIVDNKEIEIRTPVGTFNKLEEIDEEIISNKNKIENSRNVEILEDSKKINQMLVDLDNKKAEIEVLTNNLEKKKNEFEKWERDIKTEYMSKDIDNKTKLYIDTRISALKDLIDENSEYDPINRSEFNDFQAFSEKTFQKKDDFPERDDFENFSKETFQRIGELVSKHNELVEYGANLLQESLLIKEGNVAINEEIEKIKNSLDNFYELKKELTKTFLTVDVLQQEHEEMRDKSNERFKVLENQDDLIRKRVLVLEQYSKNFEETKTRLDFMSKNIDGLDNYKIECKQAYQNRADLLDKQNAKFTATIEESFSKNTAFLDHELTLIKSAIGVIAFYLDDSVLEEVTAVFQSSKTTGNPSVRYYSPSTLPVAA